MVNGIYHVTFSSNSNDFGDGIAVFKDDTVNGGDHGYVYSGTTIKQGEQFTATLTIKRWNSSVQSVFGPISEFVLELSGNTSSDNSFIAHGHIAGQPQAKISIRGKHLSTAS